ncbi:Nuclear pore complex protein [Vigna angularis]|uniref:Nuclear pore complex protein Nup85 n=1 Tax=Phaseolus angularis TaxID=3914 RepID=A0A8T0JY56_PHAAN|nr:Nuclear pore complex protein [Vigna angularis]
MPSDTVGNGALVPLTGDLPTVYPLHHGLASSICSLSISWSRGNTLHLSLFSATAAKVVEVKLTSEDPEIPDVHWRRIAYGSVAPFALLQSRRSSISALLKTPSPYHSDWWENVLQYSKEIGSLLGVSKLPPSPIIDDSKTIVKRDEEPTSLKAAWELIEIFYVDKQSQSWLPERLVDWLADYDSLFTSTHETIHGKLVDFQKELINIQIEGFGLILLVIEDDPRYWELLSSALSVGWLDIVVKMLRLHGSYQLDQLSKLTLPELLLRVTVDRGGAKRGVTAERGGAIDRSTAMSSVSFSLVGRTALQELLLLLELRFIRPIHYKNGLVETVATLISKMPRFHPESVGKLGECYKSKPDFIKSWEKWRSQITKLDCSPFWIQCDNQQTVEGLRNLLQIMLGNTDSLCMATCYWIELYISHFLYIRPFTMGIESMCSLAQKCIQLKPQSNTHRLAGLMVGILEENTEVVLAECSREFGPWLVAHAIELLTAGSEQAEVLLHEQRYNLGGISIVELHRLVYAQILSSHALTWQIAPIYLSSCVKQGMGLLENLLYRQSIQHNNVLLKNIEICRLYELDHISSNIMKIAGVYHWKHGHKGAGVFWLQQAQDSSCLDRIAQQLFDSVGKSISDESFKQWEGMIELLGSESKPAGGLEFLHKYRDFKKSLQKVSVGKSTEIARQAVGSLMLLMKNPSTPQRFWLPLLYDSLKLLNWKDCPLLGVSETNLLLNKLQDLSLAKLRPYYTEPSLPPDALSSIRLALATNLGRAILDE